jgi:SGNH domain (fused to AT3 domains)
MLTSSRTLRRLFLASVIAVTLVIASQVPTVAASHVYRSFLAKDTAFPWKGHDPSCSVLLPAPGPPQYERFTTCPPKRVLLVGDSVALTMGIQMALGQEKWGALMDDQAINGCGFVTGYPLEHLGSFAPMNPHCDQEVSVWTADARQFKPQAIVVELGWWDSYQHMINGQVESLSQPQYDTLVEQHILSLIQGIRSASSAPLFFLSVPWMNPPALPSGQQEPAASAASHNEINSLIQQAVSQSSQVHFVDISPYITPSGQFSKTVDGGICRASDGVHLYYGALGTLDLHHTQCGKALQKGVLSLIRQELEKR